MAEFFKQVEYKAGFSRSISMEVSAIRIKASQGESFFDLGIKDAVSVVERAVEAIERASCLSARPFKFGRDNTRDGLPVFLRRASFDGENLFAHGLDLLAFQLLEFVQVVAHLYGDQHHFFVQ